MCFTMRATGTTAMCVSGSRLGPAGERREGAGDPDEVAVFGGARLERQPRRGPAEVAEGGPDAALAREVPGGEVARRGRRHLGHAVDELGRALHRLGARAEARHHLVLDRGQRPARMARGVGLDRFDLRLRRAARRTAPLRRADAGEDVLSRRVAVAQGHSIALTMSSTTFFASPNTIIVLSM
jgi:hypothetical protein